jgi:hypothetical protein
VDGSRTESRPRFSRATTSDSAKVERRGAGLLRRELGYLQLDRRGAELLFQVLTEREERSAIAIASNEPFSSWTKTFTDPRLCAVIVDRLTFAGQIIETGSTSYRFAHARNARPASCHQVEQTHGGRAER